MTHPNQIISTKSKVPARILEMDALRGLAAIAVVLFHYTTRYQQLFGHEEPLAASVPWGHYGVDLFFMLSGFVILMTLERTSDSLKFAWGRFSRLYPTYWAAAALTFVVVGLCGLPGEGVSLRDALLNLTMVQALLGASHIDGAYWSLQAELIFYVNMLAIFRLGCFRRPVATIIAWLTVAAIVTTLQSFTESVGPLSGALLSKMATIASLKYIPLFGIGVLLYDLKRPTLLDKPKHMRLCNYSGIACCLIAVGIWHGLASLAIDAALATLLWLAISRRVPLLAARPLVWLGAISYSLYLTHQNIGYVLMRYLQSSGISPMLSIFAACTLALCLAAALHYTVERPTMRRLRGIDLLGLLQRLTAQTWQANS